MRAADQKIAVGHNFFLESFEILCRLRAQADANRNGGTSEFHAAYSQEILSDERALINPAVSEVAYLFKSSGVSVDVGWLLLQVLKKTNRFISMRPTQWCFQFAHVSCQSSNTSCREGCNITFPACHANIVRNTALSADVTLLCSCLIVIPLAALSTSAFMVGPFVPKEVVCTLSWAAILFWLGLP